MLPKQGRADRGSCFVRQRLHCDPDRPFSSAHKVTMPKKTVDLSQPHAQHDIHAFLDALNTGGGKPMEQMKPKEARRVLEDAQRSVEVPLREVEISEKPFT